MKGGPKIPRGSHMANDGFTPAVTRISVSTNGFKPNPQGGYVAPTQSAPANPPSGGSSGKPATGSGGNSNK
jgi:hypothetical protein